MRLTFDLMEEGAEEAAFAAIDDLQERLEASLRDLRSQGATGLDDDEIAGLCGDAGLALGYKLQYGDGRLADWSVNDVRDYLLEWCPRKVTAPPDLAASIPLGLVALVSFLATAGLLAGGEARLARLQKEIQSLLVPFMDAVADDTKFGMAKSIFSSIGLSPDDIDQADLGELMTQFNALPDEQRFAAIGRGPTGPFAEPEPIELPPVVLPDPAAAEDSARASKLVGQLRALAAFCGDGRKLTKKGNLTLADAKQAVIEIETGDVVDGAIGDHVYKTRSAEDLPGLQRVYLVAKKAGVIRLQHGKAIATKRGATFGADALDAFLRTVRSLIDIGPIQSARAVGHDYWLGAVDEVADENTVALLALLYTRQAPLSVTLLAADLADELIAAFSPAASAYWTDERFGEHAVVLIEHLADILTDAGVVVRTGAAPSGPSGTRLRGGELALTPAGVIAVRQVLVDNGFRASTFEPSFVNATAGELLDELVDIDDVRRCIGESAAWRQGREPEAATIELIDAATNGDRRRAAPAFQMLRDLGADVAGPHVRGLEQSERPQLRGLARAYRAEHEGLFAPRADGPEAERARVARLTEVLEPHDHAAFLFVLEDRLMTDAITETLQDLDNLLTPEEQIAFVGTVWRIEDEITPLVLELLSKTTAHKKVAKASRKALLQHGSYIARVRH